jgi:DNA-binding transcriptional LysR family regulator
VRHYGYVDLTKLRAFVTLAEYLHFGHAADALHLTQPGLSRQIQTLERQLGARLLERDRRNVTLTDAGRQLLEDAVPLLAAAHATRQRVTRAARGPRRLVVGFRAGVIPTAAIAAIRRAYPDLEVEVKRLESDDQERNLLCGDVDVAYVRAPINGRGLRLIALYREGRLVALPHDHPLADAIELSERELREEGHLRYLEPPAPGGTPIRSVEEKLEHVAAGRGIIMLPLSATQHYTRPDVVYVPVVDGEPDQVWLAVVAGRDSEIINDFVIAAAGAVGRSGHMIAGSAS